MELASRHGTDDPLSRCVSSAAATFCAASSSHKAEKILTEWLDACEATNAGGQREGSQAEGGEGEADEEFDD